jgi:hypothetical protein
MTSGPVERFDFCCGDNFSHEKQKASLLDCDLSTNLHTMSNKGGIRATALRSSSLLEEENHCNSLIHDLPITNRAAVIEQLKIKRSSTSHSELF